MGTSMSRNVPVSDATLTSHVCGHVMKRGTFGSPIHGVGLAPDPICAMHRHRRRALACKAGTPELRQGAVPHVRLDQLAFAVYRVRSCQPDCTCTVAPE